VLVRYATNNSMASRERYVERLGAFGIATATDEIVTSTSATIAHLRRHLVHLQSILAAGSPGMTEEFMRSGFDVTTAAELATEDYQGQPLTRRFDAVVVGLDQAYDYGRIAVAATAIRQGAVFIATNADLRYPTPVGFLPGAGSLVAAIRAATGGVEPMVVGKPGTAMFEAILEEAEVHAEAAVVVGDNPDADVVAARHARIFAILVLTGVTDARIAASLQGDRRPDLVVAGPSELLTCFESWLSPPG
jgi:4-nitrophenyl phosphatase